MRRILLLCVATLGVFAFGLVVHAQGADEQVKSLSADIRIHSDASVDVTETIVYDFGASQRHGIFRDIAVRYPTAFGDTSIGLDHVQVVDGAGAAYPFDVSRSGNNEEIKIGDPYVLISGVHTYTISYRVTRAIGYFDAYDELYWNVTGNDWRVPIDEVHATITLPQEIPLSQFKAYCYQGAYGSNEPCAFNPFPDSVQSVTASSSRPLAPGEGLTIAVGFPKGLVTQPTLWQSLLQTLLDNWVLGVPIIVLLGMTALWWVMGSDPRGRGTVIPEYDAPENLTPIEVAAVLKEGGTLKNAISAEIIYLATRGYLSLQRINEKVLFLSHADYSLQRLKANDGLPAFDSELLDGLFLDTEFKQGDTVSLSDLRDKFYARITSIQKSAYQSVIAKHYFPADPTKVRYAYVATGLCIAVLGGVVALGGWGDVSIRISGIISGVIIALFGLIMPRVTKEGAIMRERIKGLKLYLEVAEKARIEFQNAPEKNPQLFEKLLPYAMVLGVEKQWAKQFEGIYTQPPNWYRDSSLTTFNAALFAGSLNSFSSSASHTLASTPAPSGGSGVGGGGFSGGGFSGGGFGGGGGGSW